MQLILKALIAPLPLMESREKSSKKKEKGRKRLEIKIFLKKKKKKLTLEASSALIITNSFLLWEPAMSVPLVSITPKISSSKKICSNRVDSLEI